MGKINRIDFDKLFLLPPKQILLFAECFIHQCKKYLGNAETWESNLRDPHNFVNPTNPKLGYQLYIVGKIVKKKNPELSTNCYYFSAMNGYSLAYHELGMHYLDKNNIRLSKIYFKIASKNGVPESMFRLANIYNREDKPDKAIKYWLLEIKHGVGYSCSPLGVCYANSDYKIAKTYWKIGFGRKLYECAGNLASYYFDKRNYDKMRVYCKIVIEYDNCELMKGAMYLYIGFTDIIENGYYYYTYGCEPRINFREGSLRGNSAAQRFLD